MNMRRGIGFVIVGATAVVGLGFLASTPASADDHAGQIKVDVDNQMGADVEFCIKSDTSMKKPRGSDRACSGTLLTRKTKTLYVDGGPDDHVWLDFEVFGEHTHDNFKEITGSHQCTATGVTIGFKVDCPGTIVPAQSFSEKPLTPFAINAADPNDPGMRLLNLLAWSVSAAAVAGFIIVGMNMAVQLRRGDPGEFSEHWRGFLIVGLSSILGMTAGPIVDFLHPWT
jgi:hypothetical protein